MKKVAVIGGGTMGNGIAHTAASERKQGEGFTTTGSDGAFPVF
jgi:3-hydroxyacyl-CoA dehydrogenase